MPLTTTSKVKLHLGISDTDTSQDDFLGQLLAGVEAAFAKLTDRHLELQDYVCYLSGMNSKVLLLPEYPVDEVTEVRLDRSGYYGQAGGFGASTVLSLGTDYALVKDGRGGEAETARLYKINGVWPGRWEHRAGLLSPVMRPGAGNVRVEYSSGMDPIPDDVQLCLWQCCATLKEMRANGKMIQNENFEEYGVGWSIPDALKLMSLPGYYAQVVAKYRRITPRLTGLA